MGVVEKVEAEVEQRAAHRLAIYFDVFFEQVPATGPHHEHGGFGVQLVLLGGRAERNSAAHGITQVDLALNDVFPSRGVGVFQVGHEHLGPGIEGVDNHLAFDRTGDFHAAVEQIGRYRSYRPVALADGDSLGQEIGQLASLKIELPLGPTGQHPAPTALEVAVQLGHERQRRRREDFGEFRRIRAEDLHSFGREEGGHGGGRSVDKRHGGGIFW